MVYEHKFKLNSFNNRKSKLILILRYKHKENFMAVRLIFLILIVMLFSWGYQNLKPDDFTKENITEQIKKEKTINAVQTAREKRYQEAERAMQD